MKSKLEKCRFRIPFLWGCEKSPLNSSKNIVLSIQVLISIHRMPQGLVGMMLKSLLIGFLTKKEFRTGFQQKLSGSMQLEQGQIHCFGLAILCRKKAYRIHGD